MLILSNIRLRSCVLQFHNDVKVSFKAKLITKKECPRSKNVTVLYRPSKCKSCSEELEDCSMNIHILV